MNFGCAWYPEHWPESRWDEDLTMMRAAGMNTVRIAEFAWSSIEPHEGTFTLDWIDRAIEAAASHGFKVVLGTPSAAPPPWLTQRYPEVLAVGPSGIRRRPGSRCEYAPANRTYTRLASAVAEVMAKQFGRHPSVIGWQIDNEYKSISHDDDTRSQFRDWLAEKYGTLDELNRRWCGAYWSQTYNNWDEIPLPARSAESFPDEHYHPALHLEWRRFQGVIYRRFQAAQIAAVRAHAGREQWVTHNFMGFFDAFDHYEVAQDLDFVSWDSYVPTPRPDHFANGASHDLMRGLKRKNFWLMETQPGFVNWRPANNTLDPGEIRTMAWHAVGHGADAVAYWQWRSAPNCQEQYHGSILGADGNPRPIYEEIARIGHELAALAPHLADTTPRPRVALLHSYDSRWAIDFQRHHHGFDPVQQIVEWYRPLRQLGHDVEIVHPAVSLDAFDLVVAPSLHLIEKEMAAKLIDFVEQGGHLVIGPRSGVKDMDNALLPSLSPGPLACIAPGTVREYYALEESIEVRGTVGDGRARIWGEWIECTSEETEVLLRYSGPMTWLDQQCAAAARRVKAGHVTQIGSWFDRATMLNLMKYCVAHSRLRLPAFVAARSTLPEGIEVCHRQSDVQDIWIVINHGREARQLPTDVPIIDCFDGGVYDAVSIEPLSVRVFRIADDVVQ